MEEGCWEGGRVRRRKRGRVIEGEEGVREGKRK